MEGLYFVTDDRVTSDDLLFEMVRAVVEQGCTTVQLREKQCSTKRFLERAFRLKELLQGLGAKLYINDRIDVALAVQADGVHLGQNDMPYQKARELVGPEMLIGLSVSTLKETIEANKYNLSYIGAGTVFSTATKADVGTPLGIDGLTRICRVSKHPVVAIGGIDAGNAGEAATAGAIGVAVVSAISQADDYSAAAVEILKAFNG